MRKCVAITQMCMATTHAYGKTAGRTHSEWLLRAKHLGLARTIYIRCIYGIFGWEITKYTVMYGAYIRFWPTLKHRPNCNHRYFNQSTDSYISIIKQGL